MNLVKMNKMTIIDCDTFFNVFKYYEVYNENKEAYNLLSIKPLIRASNNELI